MCGEYSPAFPNIIVKSSLAKRFFGSYRCWTATHLCCRCGWRACLTVYCCHMSGKVFYQQWANTQDQQNWYLTREFVHKNNIFRFETSKFIFVWVLLAKQWIWSPDGKGEGRIKYLRFTLARYWILKSILFHSIVPIFSPFSFHAGVGSLWCLYYWWYRTCVWTSSCLTWVRYLFTATSKLKTPCSKVCR